MHLTYSNSICVTPGAPIEALDAIDALLVIEGRWAAGEGFASTLVVDPFLDIGSMATDLREMPVDGRCFSACKTGFVLES